MSTTDQETLLSIPDMSSVTACHGSVASINGTGEKSTKHEAHIMAKPSDYAMAHIPSQPVGGFHGLGPRKDRIFVQITDIMRPFRLPALGDESDSMNVPKRPNVGSELVGIGAQFASTLNLHEIPTVTKGR
ncbi:uncharacterized protein CTRU02_206159 [Colletotrichum truncatum]|uniref:Uncharacterized protein n=1 Tax=Colletotrichum truncatum TaxID=5467 RepID=A0ACC3Z634_COLTU|nr:uncharacterized protein CTRU02_10423 [Colletotrichum truncatum]KAF6787160.1 hypothetical protein CTRU02_10423 [Colletotrichum truncatum]